MTEPSPWHDPTAAARSAARLKPMRDIEAERQRQDRKWGEQNHPDGTGPTVRVLSEMASYFPYSDPGFVPAAALADAARMACKGNGTPETPDTWTAILLEEVFEALAEDDSQRLRTELIQVAAVAAQWAEVIDRRA